MGQLTASCVAGGLCFKDALILVYERQRLTDSEQADADAFEAIADQFNYYPPNLPLICGISGQAVPIHRSLGGSYWKDQVHETPLVGDALQSFFELNCDIVWQIGPALQADSTMAKELKTFTPAILGALRADESGGYSIIDTLETYYVAGSPLNFVALYQDRVPPRMTLPGYPFQKKRYWITEIARFLNKENAESMTAGASTK